MTKRATDPAGKRQRTGNSTTLKLRSGDRLGSYIIERLIGAGGQAEVYLARDVTLRRLAAVKALRPMTDRMREQVLAEARVVATLDHPNVVRVYHVEVKDSICYMAMEYVEGGNLHRKMRRMGNLSPEEALEIVIQAADALHHAHQRGVIHRDIKPQNLLLTKDGALKLADFGLALLTSPGSGSEAERWVGTPQFMPPEIWLGEKGSEQSDLYSLGACLFFLLTGAAPFSEETIEALRTAHVQKMPEIPESIPRVVGDLIVWLMAKSRSGRPSSAAVLHEEAQRILSELTGRQDALVRLRNVRANSEADTDVLRYMRTGGLAAERAVLALPVFEEAETQLLKALGTQAPLLIFSGRGGRLLLQVAQKAIGRIPETCRVAARVDLPTYPPTVMDALLRSAGLATEKTYDQANLLVKKLSKGAGPGQAPAPLVLMQIHRGLDPTETEDIAAVATAASQTSLGLLVCCDRENARALSSHFKMSAMESLVRGVDLRDRTPIDVMHILRTWTESATSEAIRWTRDAVLMALDCEERMPDRFGSTVHNAIAIALSLKKPMITSWCLEAATAHPERIQNQDEIQETWQSTPSTWPDAAVLSRLKGLRSRWNDDIPDFETLECHVSQPD
jgi:tRNA A-37 threonylcarbamoyl transferase component Bud32